jgi:D-arabinose 1-dehydrogenase-like Zn-dependent alcohol dehydrogenase
VVIEYCSFTRGDIGFIDNQWGDTSYPLVPGYEIFGVVQERGEKVKDFKVGDYIGIGYQVSSCFRCQYCRNGKEQFCKKQRLICVSEYGGLADHIVVDSRFVLKYLFP